MLDKLKDWNESFPLSLQQQYKLQQRRAFLSGFVKTAFAAAALPIAGSISGCTKSTPVMTNNELASKHPWHTFYIVQEHLFPDNQNGP